MSSMSQSNGKKSGSGSNSTVNTPASTPVTSMAGAPNGQTATQTSPPPNNAPKYGTLVPNRIFVGGISANTTEGELLQLFSNYGTVKAAKIIQDRAGVSKGYGFITFESEDDAKRLQREADNIVLRERKLNIAPAIKKQPFSRAFDASSPPAVTPGNPAQYYFQPGTMPYFQSSVAYYPPGAAAAASGDPNSQQPPIYQTPSVYPTQSGPPQAATYPPVMFPAQPIYMPQQYPMPMPYDYNYYANGGPQYMVGGQGGPQSQVPPMQRSGSPPRPPCYGGQQLPYNPETVYYNVPVYGAAVEGPAMYQDALDVGGPNGPIAEDAFALDECIRQDLDRVPKELAIDHSRQSNTPVVSLLSLDQHQEKDFTSMQSGRRRKSTAPTNNGYYNFYPANNYNPFHSYTTNTTAAAVAPPAHTNTTDYTYNNNNNLNRPPVLNGYQDKSWVRKRKVDKRSFETTSSLSSLRTDSNSSASVAEDYSNTPPPPPYSPMLNNNNNHKLYSTKNFHASSSSRPKSYNGDLRRPPVGKCAPETSVLTPPLSSPPQVHPQQHFIPPARRNRRSVRRSTPQALSEIGAGDAPLPNNNAVADVSDACKKMDGLKL